MALSELQVRNAKPSDKMRKLSDSEGLYLLINVSGSKLWRYDYRFDGKRKTLALGAYAAVGLAEARRRRDEARRHLAENRDPGQQKQMEKREAKIASENTFKAVATEWLERRQRGAALVEKTVAKSEWLLSLAYADFGDRPVASITAPEILATLRKLEVRGKLHSAVRARSTFSQVFRYAIASGYAERDPAADLIGALTPPKVTHRAAVLDPQKIGPLLRAIDAYDGHVSTIGALKLAPLVFVRPSELRFAEWRDIDLKAARWRIPAIKMKMRREHVVPLARQAVEVLEWMQQFSGSGELVFPSVRSSTRPMSDMTINAALRRLGYEKNEMSAHGFRRIASTLLNELGWNPDWIEIQLAHVEGNGVRRAYNAAQYLPGRTEMMQAWADYLDRLRSGGKIISP